MKTILVATLSIILISTSCIGQKPKTKVVKENRNLSGYNSIYTYSSIDIFVKQGEKESVIVETNEEYQKLVVITVDGSKLNIKVKENIYNPDKFNVYITVKNLKEIRSAGSGDIETEGILKFDDLYFKSNGSGDVELNLESKLVTIETNGSGDVELKGNINELNIHSFGSGDIEIEKINFSKVLVSMSGSGDLKFIGSADLFNVDLSGSGDLEAENFKAQELNANSGGSGDIVINVEEIANVNLTGSGNFKLIGNPTTKNLKSSGSGDFY